jgi:multiple sugar transport system ATP-binding protein
MAEVQLTGVTKRFGGTIALQPIDLHVPNGSFFVLLGPSGAGKTTLLRLVAGLETPEAGEIRFGGEVVNREPPAARNVAMVFQQYSLYPNMTVRENLAFPLRSPLLRTPPAEIERRVLEVARTLRIESKLPQRVTNLSGGEMQRVSIGRALVREPAVFLMDEPLSSLDAKLRADLRLELKTLHIRLQATILYVTHDQVEAMTLATQAGVLVDGRLLQVGTPRELYEHPATIEVALRLGIPRINLLPADLFGRPPAGAERMGVRAEHLLVSARPATSALASGSLVATVHRLEHLGDQTRLHLHCRGVELVALADAHTAWRAGDEVSASAARQLFFDARGVRLPDATQPHEVPR